MTSDVVEHSDDGRYIVVDGRRWRATDPAVPEKFRAELVAELMAARRDVRTDPETAAAPGAGRQGRARRTGPAVVGGTDRGQPA